MCDVQAKEHLPAADQPKLALGKKVWERLGEAEGNN